MKPVEGLKSASPKDTFSSDYKLPQDYNVVINGKPTPLYMSPEEGPFKCGNCEYFQAPNACQLVEGKIEAEGCCSLYEKGGHSEPDEDDIDANSDATRRDFSKRA